MSSLLATSGHQIGRRFPLREVTRIGRAPENDIVLHGNLVSRFHAEIVRSGAGFVISDLDSKNGIFINERPEKQWRLKRGDRIGVGENTLIFNAPQELKTARFTNTLIHLDPDQDETMRVIDRPPPSEEDSGGEATALILKLAQIFDSSSDDLPEVLQTMLGHLLELFGATAGSILLRSRDGAVVPLTAVADGNELHLSRSASRAALVQGNAVLTSSLFMKEGENQPASRARRAMIVPMFDREEVFGAIHLERPEGSDYSLKDIQFLRALSRLVSGAVRQAIRIDQLGQAGTNAQTAILGESPAMKDVRASVKRVATTDTPVLITGETGTGKELIARAIHDQSGRAGNAFIAINCAAVPHQLLESEFFGHERGAFTGADAMKRGKFEIADNGTLFLDEIGEMAVDLQPKLLRFLEEQIYYRVGGVRPIQTDVRIIAATNRELEGAIAEGLFRNDLFYRLNVMNIPMPPLRKRKEDIPVLINEYAPKLAARLGKPFVRIDSRTWSALENYSWPGNVRELLQSLERAFILSDDGILTEEHFQIPAVEEHDIPTGTVDAQTPTTGRAAPGAAKEREVPPTLAEVEKIAIMRALQYAKGNRNNAAELLGVHRNTLRNKMKDYGIKG